MTDIVIYSKPDCSFCQQAKNLLTTKGFSYTEQVVGRDISRDVFMSNFPMVKTVPQIVVDGVCIGGYSELAEAINTNSLGKTFITD